MPLNGSPFLASKNMGRRHVPTALLRYGRKIMQSQKYRLKHVGHQQLRVFHLSASHVGELAMLQSCHLICSSYHFAQG